FFYELLAWIFIVFGSAFSGHWLIHKAVKFLNEFLRIDFCVCCRSRFSFWCLCGFQGVKNGRFLSFLWSLGFGRRLWSCFDGWSWCRCRCRGNRGWLSC